MVVKALGDFNVELELRAWLDNEREHLASRPELRERVLETLREAKVDMPFETFRVEPLQVQIAP